MAFDSTLGAAHPLASDTPQQSLTLVAVCGGSGCPHLKIMRGGTGDGINEGLKGLFIDMTLLHGYREERSAGSEEKALWRVVIC